MPLVHEQVFYAGRYAINIVPAGFDVPVIGDAGEIFIIAKLIISPQDQLYLVPEQVPQAQGKSIVRTKRTQVVEVSLIIEKDMTADPDGFGIQSPSSDFIGRRLLAANRNPPGHGIPVRDFRVVVIPEMVADTGFKCNIFIPLLKYKSYLVGRVVRYIVFLIVYPVSVIQSECSRSRWII